MHCGTRVAVDSERWQSTFRLVGPTETGSDTTTGHRSTSRDESGANDLVEWLRANGAMRASELR